MRFIRVLLWLTAVPILVLFAWWIYNRIDEPPSAYATVLAEPFDHSVSDQDNAWLYLLGLGATEYEDPVALGRRRVDAYEARMALRPVPDADAAERTLFDDPVTYTEPSFYDERDRHAFCPDLDFDCLVWSRHTRGLSMFEAENTLLLQRYDALLGMEQFEELYTPSLSSPVLDFRIDALYNNLILRDLAEDADPPTVARTIARAHGFWRLASENGRSMLVKIVAGRMMERYQRRLDAAIDQATPQQLIQMAADVERVLAVPTTAQRDMRPAIRSDFQAFAHTLDNHFIGTGLIIRSCWSGEMDHCLGKLFSSQGYAPQATRNLMATYWQAVEQLSNGDARTHASEIELLGEKITQNFIYLDDAGRNLDNFLYNPVGKIFAAIAIPTTDWPARFHDAEALRRMYQLKFDARLAAIEADNMVDWLNDRPDELRNPYNGEAFDWDPVQSEIHFQPLAPNWNRQRLNVTYRIEHPQSIGRCLNPIRFLLTIEGESGTGTMPYRLTTCGTGIGPPQKSFDGLSEEQMEMFENRFDEMTARQHEGRVGIRFLLLHGSELLAYELPATAPDPTATLDLSRLGHNSGPGIKLDFERVKEAYASLHVIAKPGLEIGKDIASTLPIEVHGLELLSEMKLTMRFDAIPIKDALDLLADFSNLWLVEHRPGVYEFSSDQPSRPTCCTSSP